jgi:hypothetical protein
MNKFWQYWCLGVVVMLTACAPEIETLDLNSVPDIPEDMLREQEQIQKELSADRKQVLEEIRKQEVL